MQEYLKSFSTVPMLIYLAGLLILTALCDSPAVQAAVYFCVLFLIYVSDKGMLKKSAVLAGLMGIPVIIINPLTNGMGSTIFLTAGAISITLESLVFALSLSMKLMNTVLIFMLFNILVHPDRLTALLSFAASRFALIISIAVRLVPAVSVQLREIGEIQRTRGADMDSRKLMQRIRSWYPFVRLTLLSTLEKAQGMAEAMGSKAYGSGSRTVLFSEHLRPRDLMLSTDGMVISVLVVIGLNQGWLAFEFFPQLSGWETLSRHMLFMSAAAVCILFPAITAWGCKHCHYSGQKI